MLDVLVHLCLLLVFSAATSFAQTITTTDALGQTVVEVVTIDPQLGLPSTQILETLTGAPVVSSSTQANGAVTVSTLAPDVQQGPVGQPAASTAGGPIAYTYTTTDAAGATVAVADVFTPTSPLSTPFTPSVTGTILDYTEWLSLVGTNTVAPQTGSAQRLGPVQSWMGFASAVAAGAIGGGWLVFA